MKTCTKLFCKIQRAFLLPFLITTVFSANSQTPPIFNSLKEKDSLYKHNFNLHLGLFLLDNNIRHTLCLRGVSFVKFRVNIEGGLMDISSSVDTPVVIAKLLHDMVSSTDKMWIPQKNKDNISETSNFLILPFYYNFPMACKDIFNAPEDFLSNINNMMRFQDQTNLQNQKVYILPPVINSAMPDADVTLPQPKRTKRPKRR